ncbi:hypothetical protein CEXT_266461 [Caerostris extrusa]|uniref:Uncharacterized protein n=1 Tax=Caerostris extrusa TaxID=172846 RepID=A0AAV4S706_CAEEX|nr:hypothetical protein CEXT_266461 [Caerostris extrusa]
MYTCGEQGHIASFRNSPRGDMYSVFPKADFKRDKPFYTTGQAKSLNSAQFHKPQTFLFTAFQTLLLLHNFRILHSLKFLFHQTFSHHFF